jgi:glycosyltransferase involved in cell wall biosynthesis
MDTILFPKEGSASGRPVIKPCVVVPVYNHEAALPETVEALRSLSLPCYLVDDGSRASAARVLDALAARESAWVTLLRHERNQGKGAAVATGWAAAQAAGYTHAVQVDADGQHAFSDIPKLLALAERQPRAVVTGIPVYDESVPKARLYGRYLTHVWVWINTLSLEIRDSMCGLRVYPLAETLAVWNSAHVSRRMAFDTDILVRLWWRGVPLLQVPTRVTYPADGVSHFDLLWDNVRITGMHARLFFGMLLRLPWLLARLFRRQFGARAPGTEPLP